MSFRVNANTASISAQRFLEKSQRSAEKSLSRLASGSRVVRAGDDAAGFAISESLRGQISGVKQAKNNAHNAQAMIQTAEGGLAEQNNILVRLRELAVYAASDTVGDNEREFLNKEFVQLSEEFDRIAKTTTFGHNKLLTGDGKEFQFQVGPGRGEENIISFTLDANTTADEVGVAGLGIEDQSDALSALDDIDDALLTMAGTRSTFGAAQSRFNYAIDHLAVQSENLQGARSHIADVDIAEEVSNLTKAKISQDLGVAVLAQANSSSTRAMSLIGAI